MNIFKKSKPDKEDKKEVVYFNLSKEIPNEFFLEFLKDVYGHNLQCFEKTFFESRPYKDFVKNKKEGIR